jgi:hypothetical protein
VCATFGIFLDLASIDFAVFSEVKYGKQYQQGKVACNERNPATLPNNKDQWPGAQEELKTKPEPDTRQSTDRIITK